MAYKDSDIGLPLDGAIDWITRNNTGFGTGKLFENIPLEIAQKSARLVPGQDIIFNSADKNLLKVINTWKRKNNMMEKLRQSELIASLSGKTILFVVPDKTGTNPNLIVVKNNYMGRVAKINEEEQYAELWTQDGQGDLLTYTETQITPTTITITKFIADKSLISTTGGENQQELQLKEKTTYKNPFGVLPVVEIPNLVINNIWGQTVFNVYPDWLPVANTIESYNILYRIFVVEGQANRTRYIGSMTPEELNRIKRKDPDVGGALDLMGDALINIGFNDSYASGTQGNGITIASGDPKLEAYTKALEWIKTNIFNGAGFSPYKNSDTYQNKTDALLANKLDKETTEMKQAIRTEKWYRIFDCVLLFYGINPYDEDEQRKYSFDIVNAGITDVTMEIQNDKELLALGLMSQAEARAQIFNEPMDLAQENVDRINKEMLEQQEAFNKQFQDTTDANNDNQPDNQIDDKELLGSDK